MRIYVTLLRLSYWLLTHETYSILLVAFSIFFYSMETFISKFKKIDFWQHSHKITLNKCRRYVINFSDEVSARRLPHICWFMQWYSESLFFARSSSPSKRCRHSGSVLRLSKYSTHNKYNHMFCIYLDLFVFINICVNHPNCKSLEQIDNCFISKFYCLWWKSDNHFRILAAVETCNLNRFWILSKVCCHPSSNNSKFIRNQNIFINMPSYWP